MSTEENQQPEPMNTTPHSESFGSDFSQEAYSAPEFYSPPAPQQPYSTPAPQQPYNIPQQSSGYSNDFPMPPANPLPFWTAVRQLPKQYWRVLTKPAAATFVDEQGKAAWNIVWVQVMALAAFSTLITWIIFNLILLPILTSLIQTSIQSTGDTSAFATQSFTQLLDAFRLGLNIAAFSPIVIVPLGFFINVGLNYLIAKMFGGKGSFLAYTYCYSLIYTPISLLSFLLSFIPLGTLAGTVYQIILQVYMTMGVHRLSGNRATAATLVLPLIGLVLSFILIFAYYLFIVSSIQSMLPPIH